MLMRLKKYISVSLQTDYARAEMRKFLNEHATGGKVLDVGGKDSPYAEFFPNRTNIDIVPTNKVDVIGSVYELPFPDGFFDAVLCTEVFEHLEDPQKAAAEIRRVIQPGGKLILTTRFLYPLHGEPKDYYRYTEYGLRMLFKKFNDIFIHAEMPGMQSMAVILQGYALEEKPNISKSQYFFLLFCAKMIKFFTFILPSGKQTRLASGYYVVCTK